MKIFALVLLALLGVSHALPTQQVDKVLPQQVDEVLPQQVDEVLPQQQVDVVEDDSRNARFIGDIIVSIIESITENLPDPWSTPGTDIEVGLPVRTLFNIEAHVDNVYVAGISNIIINRMNFGLLSNRLDMDISLPRLAVSIADSGLEATILGSQFDFSASNINLVILEPRIAGYIQFNVGIISGITVRDIELGFTLRDLQYNGQVKAFGFDLSGDVHHLVNTLIPNRMRELETDINELVEIIALELINIIL